MTSRERFLAACAARPTDRPPVWIMRQAGRYLPEYRRIKERHGFAALVRTPELAAEITLQPVRRFPFDAAILFSDILVLPEALGQGYRFRDEGGIAMDFRLEGRARIDALKGAEVVPERLAYVGEALALVKKELGGQKALLGFGGSPWTLAAYMAEGGSSADFGRAKALFYSDRPAFEALMEKLTAALVAYFQLQIRAGADALQIFDSWGGILAGADYEAASLQWIRRIVQALPENFPVILYAKGTAPQHPAQAAAGLRVLSVDWTVDLPALHARLNPGGPPAAAREEAGIALQGNLDPTLLNLEPEIVRREALRLLAAMRGRAGYLFNLGHGIRPEAKIACVEALVQAVAEDG